ncbi:hypothetical protein TVAG_021150 [Trichomonas vaginalis G3]|uniref:Uncharacterized protein n=1 Tax=Trichomonas vaginalis (strain ATCC PRA-98 / G3) TaxID=412133 RepID=A2DH97_TRIV3|nr:hypothetical protein TVAGG3_0677550 [Trichomonas vaginalis G3]EAY20170.1 hypothetical protein TVAG_021150 [Trichomonas vaginalis G3]KAI5507650.1 hypothetical protein TVAGG3_0677550 [Trichomonas vaginalis G3]|eukprot:XP_001581156.1 hypothetical protein [Trichomonas vaginalis G3]
MKRSIGIGVGVVCVLLVIIAIIVVVIVIKKKNAENDIEESEEKSLEMIENETGAFSSPGEQATADNPLFATTEVEMNEDFGPDEDAQDSL